MEKREQLSAKPPWDSVTELVVLALRRIIRAIDVHSRFLVTHHGLTGPQLAVLKALSRQDGVSTCELARVVHLSQETVSGILTRLERQALIRRGRSDRDRRRVMVWLTRGGIDLVAHGPPSLREGFTAEFSKLAGWEQTQILSSLQRVVAMMEGPQARPTLAAERIGAPPERTMAPLGRNPPSSEDGMSVTQEAGGIRRSGRLRARTAATREQKGVF